MRQDRDSGVISLPRMHQTKGLVASSTTFKNPPQMTSGLRPLSAAEAGAAVEAVILAETIGEEVG